MSHYVITRWNVRGFGGQYRDPEWLTARRSLFTSFCLPSVRRQILDDFSWLVLIDAGTPREARGWLTDCDPRIRLVPVGADPQERAVAVRSIIRSGPGDQVITTRLDSDDAIAGTHLHAVRAYDWGVRRFVAFEYGLALDCATGQLWLRRYRLNPFLSLIESREHADSVHVQRHDHVRADELTSLASIGWLQVIHGGNLSNTLQGSPVPGSDVPALLDAFEVSGSWAARRDPAEVTAIAQRG